MSRDERRRSQLFDELSREIRLMGSLGTLYGQAVAERLGIHHTDMETLDFLNLFGPMTAGRLSELTGLTSGATTRLIDRVEAAGYIRRCRDPLDRRKVIVEATPERVPEVFAHFAPMGQRHYQAWTCLPEEDLRVVLEFFRRSNAIAFEENARIRRENLAAGAAGEDDAAAS